MIYMYAICKMLKKEGIKKREDHNSCYNHSAFQNMKGILD